MANQNEEFRDHLLAKKLSEKTIYQYLSVQEMFVRECENLDQKTINKFVADHPTWIVRACLKNLFEYFEQAGVDPRDLPKIPKVKGRNKKIKKEVAKVEDLIKIRQYLKKHHMAKYTLMFDISLYCGLRREEICNVTRESFGFKDWEKGKGMRLKVYAKGSGRIVIIPPIIAEEVLRHYLKNHEQINNRKRFFGIGVSRWDQIFRNAVKNSCDSHITLHDLRRKRATDWIDNNIDLDEVRRRLGHADLSTTQKYLIRDEEDRLEKWENSNI